MITTTQASLIGQLIQQNSTAISAEWQAQQHLAVMRGSTARTEQLRNQCDEFLAAFADAIRAGEFGSIEHRAWNDVRDILDSMSATRANGGSTSAETATFIFSLKQPLFDVMGVHFADAPEILAAASWDIGTLMDRLGLYTLEIFQKTRDQIVARQQQELLELSTPVITLWEDVVALPLIGTLDSARAQVVMENILQKIVETGAMVAIIDITGVHTVDTLVAQHLMKTIAAARLMGADCIVSGIRPQIAQTIVHLGVDLQDVTTKATLADAFLVALERTKGYSIERVDAAR
jgi:rsbT co-antagonist protein RsbR